MTVPQLALGIFFGFAAVEVFKVALAMAYETQKRNAITRELHEVTNGFIEKMHNEVIAEREAEAAKTVKRRKPVPRAKITKPLTKSQERRHAATKKASK